MINTMAKKYLGVSESVEAVIAQDNQTVATLGLTHEAIATELERVLKDAIDHSERRFLDKEKTVRGSIPSPRPLFPNGTPVDELSLLVDNTYQVFLHEWRGYSGCQWGCDTMQWSNYDFVLLNRQSQEHCAGSGLLPHYIRSHHFFGGGEESPYRVDPAKLARILNIAVSTA